MVAMGLVTTGGNVVGSPEFEPLTFSLEDKTPECCKLGFSPRETIHPTDVGKTGVQETRHKHALPIDSP